MSVQDNPTSEESEALKPPKSPSKIDFGERLRVGDPDEIAEQAAAEAEESDVTELTAEERNWLQSLLTVGRREKVIQVLGHNVHIRSLMSDDELKIGLQIKDFKGSEFYARAYQVGVVAAGVKKMDGKPLVPESLFDNGEEVNDFTERFEKARKLYPLVTTEIYEAIMNLELEFRDLMVKLGKLPG